MYPSGSRNASARDTLTGMNRTFTATEAATPVVGGLRGSNAAIGMSMIAWVRHEYASSSPGFRKSRGGVATGLNPQHFEPDIQVGHFVKLMENARCEI